MKVLMVKHGNEPHVEAVSGLVEISRFLGGNIEILYPFPSDTAALICRKDGNILGLKPNRSLRDERGREIGVIHGSFAIVGMDRDKCASLTDEQIERYKEMFRRGGELDVGYMSNKAIEEEEKSIEQEPERSRQAAPAIPDEELLAQLDEEDRWFEPKTIYEELDKVIIGQNAAKKTVAQIIHSLFEYDMPTTTLFIGPTGCGKTEIFRQIAKQWNSVSRDGKPSVFCHIFDASQVTAEGWKGNSHVSGCVSSALQFRGDFRKILIVFDEFDKIFDQKNSEVVYSDLIQDQLLKLFDHDPVYGATDDISIVCLGAFSSIYEKKHSKKRTIGFNSADVTQDETITRDDLIDFGLKPELIGRFDYTVQMNPATLTTYRQLADMEVRKLSDRLGKTVHVDPAMLDTLADEALEAQLGGRYIKHKLFALAADAIYESPSDPVIDLSATTTPTCCA